MTYQPYFKVIKMYIHKTLYMSVQGIILNGEKVKQPKWKNKMSHSHPEDYYAAMKRTKVRIHTKTWTNPENIMLLF